MAHMQASMGRYHRSHVEMGGMLVRIEIQLRNTVHSVSELNGLSAVRHWTVFRLEIRLKSG